jgi:PAS domain S-box-containing protein
MTDNLVQENGVLRARVKELEIELARQTSKETEALRRAEERLQKTVDDFLLVQQAGQVGVFDWDLQTNRVVRTQELGDILGIRRGSFENNHEAWKERVHPADLSRLESLFTDLIDSRRNEGEWEYRFIRPDGEIRWIYSKAKIIRDENGRALHMVGTDLDISRRKEMEEALRETEDRYRTFCEATFEGIAISGDGKYLDCNEQFQRMTGYSRSDLSEKKVGFLFPEENRPRMLEAILSGKELVVEYDLIRKDGTRLDVEVHGKTVRQENGRVLRFSVMRDITEHKRAEEAVRTSEERFKLLSETAGRLLVAHEPERVVKALCGDVMHHLDCEAFTNFLLDKASGRLRLNAYAGIPEEEAQRIEWIDYGAGACGQVAREGTPMLAEDIGMTQAPRTHLLRSIGIQAYACHPLKVHGRVIGTLSFGTRTRSHFPIGDIALMRTVADQVAAAMDRMELVDALKCAKDELEIKVKERTAELERLNNELRYLSSRLLTAQEEERRRIALDIHDCLAASLSAAKFKVEASQKDTSGESLRMAVSLLQDSIEECRRIQMELRPSILDDLGLLPTLSWFCRRWQTIYTGIRISQEFGIQENDVPETLKIVIFRVIQETMNNIGKHSRADRVRLSLQKSDDLIKLTIDDNGTGFDLEEPFKRPGPRKGLGLTSLRERTELSGGSLMIRSEKGKGTTIYASWPLRAD